MTNLDRTNMLNSHHRKQVHPLNQQGDPLSLLFRNTNLHQVQQNLVYYFTFDEFQVNHIDRSSFSTHKQHKRKLTPIPWLDPRRSQLFYVPTWHLIC